MSAALEVRPLALADEAAWRRMWTAYLDFYGTQVPGEVYATTFQRCLGEDPREPKCFVAALDGRPAGLVHYFFHAHAWKVEDVCYLQDLYAAPFARGKGVGRALIEAVYGAAEAAGLKDVYWMTQDDNARARRLYDRIGRLTPFIKYARR